MTSTAQPVKTPLRTTVLLLAGVIVVGAAWLLPANLRSVSPPLLHAAGEATPSLASFGQQLVESEKIGPASLVLAAARTVRDPGAPALAASLDQLIARQPSLAVWGGWDPFLDPIFNLRQPSAASASTPVVTLFLPEKARAALHGALDVSGSLGVQDLLHLGGLTATGRFVPAGRPGGQPLDALILLSAALYQSERLSPSLQRELRELAEAAVAQKELGDLEPFYLDLLALGRRLDWAQLSELLRRTEDTKTVDEYAHLARVAPDQLPLVYAAALFTDSADQVASYLIQYGKAGAEDLREGLGDGQGAVRELLLRQVPINRQAGPTLSVAGALVLAHPEVMLGLKYLGYLAGLFLLLRGLDSSSLIPAGTGQSSGAGALLRAGLLATLLAAMLVAATEPFLLHAAPISEYQFRLRLPVLLGSSSPATPPSLRSLTTMDTSTLISIGVFLLFQIVIYRICLGKIRDIDAQDITPLLKLRLMENEENLFDSGLYVGMIGTAAALVLQVVHVIQPNLLAAYSSNLFGIICVALVKIRHVRAYKRGLILQVQSAATPPVPIAS
jgi:hypothetical protein